MIMASSRLYIQMFSIHGLLRGESPELGRDADTGGQIKYVLELARTMAERPEVDQVDLITRLIYDKAVAESYTKEMEQLSDKARLVRIQCGGRKYIRKELLWPHLDEFVDKTLKFIKTLGRIPDVFHGHYADGGYVARELASIFGVPFIFTGHSMGAHKKNKLLAEGFTAQEINRRYHIDYRIGVEERIIKEAELVITSTSHEINKQYSLYENYAAGRYVVIPPGIDVDTFYPYYNTQLDHNLVDETSRQARMLLLRELHRFWVDSQKPFILALCRPDQRKNIAGLITAYGESKDLQAIANLAIFAGIRKDISGMEENERNVLTEMLLHMDRYDLYGKLAIPKKHNFSIEVPELYRLCADSHGIFVNPALVEPFGLTLIEAASCGLPIIATREGGPADIIGNCENGILIDPTSTRDIAESCQKILVDKELWNTFSSNGINGVRKYYLWKSHCTRTVDLLHHACKEMARATHPAVVSSISGRIIGTIGQKLTKVNRLLITGIDNTLVGDNYAMRKLLVILENQQDKIGWGIATGRCLHKALAVLAEYDVPTPDILITSVGSEIFYGVNYIADRGWQQHLTHLWKPDMIREVLSGLEFLYMQDATEQQRFKISYLMEDDPELLVNVHQALQSRKIRYHLEFSSSQFLDILPYRASTGKAVRYLSYKWGIMLPRIMVCGDSGNDAVMLRGDTCGVVVGNYSKELEPLRGVRKMFFSEKKYAAGIIDGINHYMFIKVNEQ